MKTHKYKAAIDADADLGDDMQASGTPHFFVNGRRLVGAQPVEKFAEIIDEELTKTTALLAKGTPARQALRHGHQGREGRAGDREEDHPPSRPTPRRAATRTRR